METRKIGIVMNGVTGRMGTNQHLIRSILAIIEDGGIEVDDDLVLLPDPILTGRNAAKLQRLAEREGNRVRGEPLRWSTDVAAAIDDPANEVVFDASSTLLRGRFVEMAARAGKSVYCEKPTAADADEAFRLAKLCAEAGVKHGVVQDKLWLPGLRKLAALRSAGFFGRILSVRGEFGYWVFSGHVPDQPPQRPSWNYRTADGGGIVVDMFCHWHYVIETLFGTIKRLVAHASVDVPERIDERGEPYVADADDSAYAVFVLEDGVTCQFNSSWCTRVRRDDLLTIQVDGTDGSAVAGLRRCWSQGVETTPRPVWNPDVPRPTDFFGGWQEVPDTTSYENAFKAQWVGFLRHHALDEPWCHTLHAGARGVELAQLGLTSWRERRWVDVPRRV